MAGIGSADDAAQLLAAGMLACAFAVLGLRGTRRLAAVLAVQGALLAAAAAWQGWLRGSWPAAVAALVVLAGSGVAVPRALTAVLRRVGGHAVPAAARPVVAPLAGAVALATLATAVLPGAGGPADVPRGVLALAAAVLLVGMMAAATRDDAPASVPGLCCAGRGALLAALCVPAVPLPGALAAGLVALELALVAGLLARREPALLDRPFPAVPRPPGVPVLLSRAAARFPFRRPGAGQ